MYDEVVNSHSFTNLILCGGEIRSVKREKKEKKEKKMNSVDNKKGKITDRRKKFTQRKYVKK